MNENLTSRQIQALKTRQNILDSALELVKKVGFEKITINDICEKAGVSVGSFYYHFKSLDFIVIETYKNVDRYFEKLDNEGVFNVDPVSKIKLVILEQLKYAENEGIDIMTQFYKSQISVGNEYFLSKDRYLPYLIYSAIDDINKDSDYKFDYTIAEDILTVSRGVLYDWCLKQGNFDLVSKGSKITNLYIDSIFR